MTRAIQAGGCTPCALEHASRSMCCAASPLIIVLGAWGLLREVPGRDQAQNVLLLSLLGAIVGAGASVYIYRLQRSALLRRLTMAGVVGNTIVVSVLLIVTWQRVLDVLMRQWHDAR